MAQAERGLILVVDDDADTCHNLSDILSDLGYRVDVAYDGPTALALVRTRPYDVVLLDFKMPDMDGLTLYREIKRIRAGTVAVIVTAYSGGTTSESARTAGAWQVLPKPVELPRLLELLNEALDQPLVMLVDDDPELCANLWDVLRNQGYRICVAHDERGAAARLKERQYKTVLIDMKLSDGNGGERVYQCVREANPKARVVLITGYRSEMNGKLEKLVAEGADAICFKPFDMEGLLQTLKRLTT